MTPTAAPELDPFTLGEEQRRLLERRIEAALEGREGPGIASVCVPVPADLDFSAVLLRARRHADRLFCLEQPGRDGYAVCGLGCAAEVETSGGDRLERAARECRRLAARTLRDDPSLDPLRPVAAGPVFMGGAAFAPDGGRAPEWEGFAPAGFVLPEVSFARGGSQARMTVCVSPRAGEAAGDALRRALERLASLTVAAMPLIDPDPVVRPRVAGAAPPSHFEEAVARAVERIHAGELEKVVLAREVRVHAGTEIDPAPVFGALREVFPDCLCYLAGAPGATFLGASPELLVRREGQRAQTVALAGTARRSADPAVDAHIGERLLQSPKDNAEHEIVARRIARALDPVSVWVATAEEPVLVAVQNVQHLATPIRAQLAEPVAALELAARLHPTPAVGGEPAEEARRLIPALEGLDRGWYAGAVGWTDMSEDGELCVALRCALLRGEVAHLYAGCGIVAGSVPAEELAESEVKLEALLPLLA